MKASDLEPLTVVPLLCKVHGLPVPEAEHQFHPPRRFRFDWSWQPPAAKRKVALEINGGVWTFGRHTRGKGYLRDMEKLNLAQMDGWIVLQCTPQTIVAMVPLLKEALL